MLAASTWLGENFPRPFSIALCLPGFPAKTLEVLSQWLPIGRVPAPFYVLLIPQRPLKDAICEVLGSRQLQERPLLDHLLRDISMSSGRLNQELGAPQLPQPEEDPLRCRLVPIAQVVDVDQTANHRPVFVSLGLLGRHEVRQSQDLQRLILEGEGRPPLPEIWKGCDSAHVRHYVDPQPRDFRLPAAKVNREPLGQELQRKGRDGDHLGVELRQGPLEAVEIGGVRQQGQARLSSAAPYNTQAWPPINRWAT